MRELTEEELKELDKSLEDIDVSDVCLSEKIKEEIKSASKCRKK